MLGSKGASTDIKIRVPWRYCVFRRKFAAALARLRAWMTKLRLHLYYVRAQAHKLRLHPHFVRAHMAMLHAQRLG